MFHTICVVEKESDVITLMERCLARYTRYKRVPYIQSLECQKNGTGLLECRRCSSTEGRQGSHRTCVLLSPLFLLLCSMKRIHEHYVVGSIFDHIYHISYTYLPKVAIYLQPQIPRKVSALSVFGRHDFREVSNQQIK